MFARSMRETYVDLLLYTDLNKVSLIFLGATNLNSADSGMGESNEDEFGKMIFLLRYLADAYILV